LIFEGGTVRDYELTIIIKPDVTDDDATAIVEKVKTLIGDRKGEITEVKPWGKKKLAYPIGQYKEGNYVLTKFKIDPSIAKDLDANLKLNEKIIRYLLIKVE
jgi:small subunit ribosomal protein S6